MDYAYANARIRAMKGRLLLPSTLENLITKPDLDSFIVEMEKTAYREELEKAGIQYTGINKVELALRKDMVNTFRTILRIMREEKDEEEDGRHIRIILHRWDVQNIKTILRGKKIQASTEEIVSCLIPAGELDEAALIELSKQPDVKTVIDVLATWGIEYARPLTKHLTEYMEKRDMALLESALDTFYYEHSFNLVKKGETDNDRIIRDFLIIEIDVTNLKTVLKMVRDRVGPEESERFLIKGSVAFPVEKLLSLIRLGNIEAVVKELAGTHYQFLSNIPEKFLSMGKISDLEKEMDQYLMKRGIRHFLGDPLGVAIALGYVWAKVLEVTNIRIIARGKLADVSDKELREALIHV